MPGQVSFYDFIMTDSTEFVPELCDNPSYDTDDFNMPRENVDKEINNYGRDLISFCQSYGMHIVNGCVTGDERGNITCSSKWRAKRGGLYSGECQVLQPGFTFRSMCTY